MGDDYGITQAVDICAAALRAVMADDAVAGEVGRAYQPGADLTSIPAVGIEPGVPWAEFRTIGGKCVTVSWRMRMLLGRWESGASLALALETYRAAAPGLRRAGLGVGTLDAPSVATVANQPVLLATFPILYQAKD